VAQLTQEANTWHLSGDLVFATISSVLAESKSREMPPELQLDFANVAEELKRHAIAHQVDMSVIGVSENLTSLMQLYGVDEIILKK
jgi:ABC-type transporter Mla MlaB component